MVSVNCYSINILSVTYQLRRRRRRRHCHHYQRRRRHRHRNSHGNNDNSKDKMYIYYICCSTIYMYICFLDVLSLYDSFFYCSSALFQLLSISPFQNKWCRCVIVYE